MTTKKRTLRVPMGLVSIHAEAFDQWPLRVFTQLKWFLQAAVRW